MTHQQSQSIWIAAIQALRRAYLARHQWAAALACTHLLRAARADEGARR